MMAQLSQEDRRSVVCGEEYESVDAYDKARRELQEAEKNLAFDAEVITTASDIENQAAEMVQKIKLYDQSNTYGPHFDAQGHTVSKRRVGHHFLGSVDLINRSWLMSVAKRMPKGAHLHVHFNSCLPAEFLIQHARDIDAMYIRSTLPLTTQANITHSRISFMVLTSHEATHIQDTHDTEKHVSLGNIFHGDYVSNSWMPYKQFQNEFKLIDEKNQILSKTEGAESWLATKLQISEEEAHNSYQTCRG
jgi:adenosine deaminase CECR1